MYNDKGINTRRGFVIVNLYASNTGTSKYIKQILTDTRREIDNDVIVIGNFKHTTYINGESSIQKINKASVVLNDTIN